MHEPGVILKQHPHVPIPQESTSSIRHAGAHISLTICSINWQMWKCWEKLSLYGTVGVITSIVKLPLVLGASDTFMGVIWLCCWLAVTCKFYIHQKKSISLFQLKYHLTIDPKQKKNFVWLTGQAISSMVVVKWECNQLLLILCYQTKFMETRCQTSENVIWTELGVGWEYELHARCVYILHNDLSHFVYLYTCKCKF